MTEIHVRLTNVMDLETVFTLQFRVVPRAHQMEIHVRSTNATGLETVFIHWLLTVAHVPMMETSAHTTIAQVEHAHIHQLQKPLCVIQMEMCVPTITVH